VNADSAEIAVRGIATFSGIPLFALSIRQRFQQRSCASR
jgi:hypothetical protein